MQVKSVFALIFAEDKVVLIQRQDVPVWVFPGGAIDPGETPEEATIREVREETGLDVEIVRRVGTYTGKGFIQPVHVFVCHPIGGALVGGDEVRDVRYWSDLPLDIPPFPEILRDARRGGPPIEKTLEITYKQIVRAAFFYPLLLARFLWHRYGKGALRWRPS